MNRFQDIDFPEPKTAGKVWAASAKDPADAAEALMAADLCPSLGKLFWDARTEHDRLAKFISKHSTAAADVGLARRELDIALAGRTHATDSRAQYDRENAASQKLAEANNLSEQVRMAEVHKRGIEQRFWLFIHPDDDRKTMPAVNIVPESVCRELDMLSIAENDSTPWAHVSTRAIPLKASKRIQSPLISGGN